jgi:hypothetical protein
VGCIDPGPLASPHKLAIVEKEKKHVSRALLEL